MTQEQALVVLVRPQADWSRTRPAMATSDPQASARTAALTAHTWSLALQVQARQIAHAWAAVDPPEAWSAQEPWLQGGTGVLPCDAPQPGDRLLQLFRTLFREGYSRVICISTRCLGLSTAVIAGGFQGLLASELVMGPTADSGLWLLGMRQLHRRVLEGVRWDQPQIFEYLVQQSAMATLSSLILPTHIALESPEDARAILGMSYADRLPPGIQTLLRETGELVS